jgi:hypothetical protein
VTAELLLRSACLAAAGGLLLVPWAVGEWRAWRRRRAWYRDTAEALAVVNERHPSRHPDTFWVCRRCGRTEWVPSGALVASHAHHLALYCDRTPVGPEDHPGWETTR